MPPDMTAEERLLSVYAGTRLGYSRLRYCDVPERRIRHLLDDATESVRMDRYVASLQLESEDS